MAEDPRLGPVRALIEKQVEMIKAGDLDGLKASVTARLQDRVTAPGVQSAVKNLGSLTIDDLVASVEAAGQGLKIKMKNGRTLTTLMPDGGAWKADTIWFK